MGGEALVRRVVRSAHPTSATSAQSDISDFSQFSQFIDYPMFLTGNRKPQTTNRLFPLLPGQIFINLKSLRRMRHVLYV
jgi:hypothetical protein